MEREKKNEGERTGKVATGTRKEFLAIAEAMQGCIPTWPML